MKKTKTFDCVEMKRQAQQGLREEFERRKGEFDSYVAFLNAKADQSPLAREIRKKIAANKKAIAKSP